MNRISPATLPSSAAAALIRRAQAHLADGRPVIAARVAQVCIEDIEPKNIEAYGVLSLAARSGKKREQAVVEASRAVFLDPRNAESRARFTSAVRELAADVSAGPIAFGARHLLSRMTTANNRAGGAGTTRGVDIVQQMHAPTGAELHIIETARLLRRHVPTRIWSVGRPHPRLLELDPTIETIAPDRLPDAETLIVAGIYQKTQAFFARLRPRRIVLIFNTPDIHHLMRWLAASATMAPETVDIAFASAALREATGIAGEVLPSPIDLDHFTPREAVRSIRTIGRVSRDTLGKHHPQDPVLYGALLAAGFDVDLLGADSVSSFLPKNERLTLRPAFSVPPRDFLHGLDLFFYRTGVIYETWGRVVTEAMACGLPVVCHRAGGYAEIIRHGENGFLFDTSEEAFDQIMAIRDDAATLRRVGEAARSTIVEDVLSPARSEQQIAFYTRL